MKTAHSILFWLTVLFLIVAGSCTPPQPGVTPDAPAVTGITLDATAKNLAVGDSWRLVATVLPSSASDRAVEWKSSSGAVVLVDSTGLVTAVAPGSTTVTATSVSNPSVSSPCVFVVSAGPPAVPSVSLYSTTGAADVSSTKVDWSGATASNLSYTGDATYSPCIQLVGNGSWGTSLAFESLPSGVLSQYTTLEFKVKTNGNSNISVKVPEVARSFGLSTGTALANGWIQMTIPLALFTSVSSAATKIAIFGDASTTIYLTDVILKELVTFAVTVKVTDGGLPLAGATVTVGSNTATTDSAGNAVFSLPKGTYGITASKSAYYSTTASVAVENAVSTAVALVSPITAPRTLTIAVRQGTGTLTTNLAEASVTVGSTTLKTGADGSAVFHVAEGSTDFSVAKPGYTALSGTARLAGTDLVQTATLSLQRQPSSTADAYAPGPGWSLSWSDEFTSPTLDSAKWSPQVLEAGHFNNELQSYTSSTDNAFIINRSGNDGALVIQALQTGTGIGMGDFSSARLITHPNGNWRYGKIAARLQVPFGQGLWPAFWMLGSNISENDGGTTPWPQSGEIDIMEKRGGTPEKERQTLGAYHFANATNAWQYYSGSTSLANPLSDDFHVYEVEWNSTSLIWRIDGAQFMTANITDPMFDEFRQNFYILLNVAVGGAFDNGFDGTATFPQSMFIDWVRVYSN